MGLKLMGVEDEELVREKVYIGLPVSTDDVNFSLNLWRCKGGYELRIEAFGTLYTLSRHKSDKIAEGRMTEAERKLDSGYCLRILDNFSASLVNPK